jgi:hypothetical protein
MLQQDRLAQFSSKVDKAKVDYQAQQQRTQAITSGLNSLASSSSSFGGAAMTAGGGGTNPNHFTASDVQYVDRNAPGYAGSAR